MMNQFLAFIERWDQLNPMIGLKQHVVLEMNGCHIDALFEITEKSKILPERKHNQKTLLIIPNQDAYRSWINTVPDAFKDHVMWFYSEEESVYGYGIVLSHQNKLLNAFVYQGVHYALKDLVEDKTEGVVLCQKNVLIDLFYTQEDERFFETQSLKLFHYDVTDIRYLPYFQKQAHLRNERFILGLKLLTNKELPYILFVRSARGREALYKMILKAQFIKTQCVIDEIHIKSLSSKDVLILQTDDIQYMHPSIRNQGFIDQSLFPLEKPLLGLTDEGDSLRQEIKKIIATHPWNEQLTKELAILDHANVLESFYVAKRLITFCKEHNLRCEIDENVSSIAGVLGIAKMTKYRHTTHRYLTQLKNKIIKGDFSMTLHCHLDDIEMIDQAISDIIKTDFRLHVGHLNYETIGINPIILPLFKNCEAALTVTPIEIDHGNYHALFDFDEIKPYMHYINIVYHVDGAEEHKMKKLKLDEKALEEEQKEIYGLLKNRLGTNILSIERYPYYCQNLNDNLKVPLSDKHQKELLRLTKPRKDNQPPELNAIHSSAALLYNTVSDFFDKGLHFMNETYTKFQFEKPMPVIINAKGKTTLSKLDAYLESKTTKCFIEAKFLEPFNIKNKMKQTHHILPEVYLNKDHYLFQDEKIVSEWINLFKRMNFTYFDGHQMLKHSLAIMTDILKHPSKYKGLKQVLLLNIRWQLHDTHAFLQTAMIQEKVKSELRRFSIYINQFFERVSLPGDIKMEFVSLTYDEFIKQTSGNEKYFIERYQF